MRLKNVLSTVVGFVLVLVFTQNAFAMTGVGDTRESAISLFPEVYESGNIGQDINLYIDSASDQDWFQWTNTTGLNKSLFVVLRPDGSTNNYLSYLRLGLIIQYPSGKETSIFYADPSYGPGDSKILSGFILPPGATVYIKIDSTSFKSPTQYNMIFRLFRE